VRIWQITEEKHKKIGKSERESAEKAEENREE